MGIVNWLERPGTERRRGSVATGSIRSDNRLLSNARCSRQTSWSSSEGWLEVASLLSFGGRDPSSIPTTNTHTAASPAHASGQGQNNSRHENFQRGDSTGVVATVA